MNWKNWLQGLFWAFATGLGSGITMAIADPEHFNFSSGWKSLLGVSSAFGLLAAGSYLKDSKPKADGQSVDITKIGAGVGAMLLACALGFGVAAMPACAGNRPPVGTYSAVGQHAFDASQLIKDINAASQTAINLNHVQGSEHLHDSDTALIRNFALVAGAGLNAWGSGATTLDAARTAVDTATLPPGIAQLARQAFDKAVADHGAGASTLVIVTDLYTILSGALSAAAQGNPKLTAILAAVAAGVAAIPAQ